MKKKKIKKILQYVFRKSKVDFRKDWINENPDTRNIPDPTPGEREKMKRFLEEDIQGKTESDLEKIEAKVRYWKLRVHHLEEIKRKFETILEEYRRRHILHIGKIEGLEKQLRLMQTYKNGADLSGIEPDGTEFDSDDWIDSDSELH